MRPQIKKINSQLDALISVAGGESALAQKIRDEKAEHEKRLESRWSLFWSWAWESRPDLTKQVYESSYADDAYIELPDRSPEARLAWCEFEDLFYATSDKTLITHHNISYARQWNLDPDDPELWRKIKRRMAASPGARDCGLTQEWAENDEVMCISIK